MIIKSSGKRDHEFVIDMRSSNGKIHTLERKDRIKYLGVMLDETVSFKYHIAYVCSRTSRNLGIISKLRYYLTLSQLKQICYSLIYPYISYAYIQKVQTMQNHAISLIFFARTFGEQTDSAVPLINLLELLPVNNVYRLHALRFTHLWHKNLLPNVFLDSFQYARSLHTYNTRHAASQNLFKNHELEQTPGNKLYPMWLPSFGKIFLLIWKILMCTSFLNKLSYISSLNNSKIPWSN